METILLKYHNKILYKAMVGKPKLLLTWRNYNLYSNIFTHIMLFVALMRLFNYSLHFLSVGLCDWDKTRIHLPLRSQTNKISDWLTRRQTVKYGLSYVECPVSPLVLVSEILHMTTICGTPCPPYLMMIM